MSFPGAFLRSLMVCAYSASLKAKRKAAVSTLWVTLGPMPAGQFSNNDGEHEKGGVGAKRIATLTLVETAVTLLAHDPLEALQHALLAALAPGHVHAALHRDVWICDARRQQLAQRADEEDVERPQLAPLLHHLLQLLEDGVLQDGVDDQHQRGHDAREQRQRPLVPDERQERAHRRGSLLWRRARDERLVRLLVALARRHARVDDPDGVREQHRRRAGDGARHHALERREPAGEAARAELSAALKGGPSPLVPVVVDEVRDRDAKEGRVEAGVEAGEALAVEDVLDGLEDRGRRTLGLDLGARGEGDERIAGAHTSVHGL